MSAPIRNCTVCSDPSLCQQHHLLRAVTKPGDWATTPVITVQECLVESDPASRFLYTLLLRLAESHGVDVSKLMGGAS